MELERYYGGGHRNLEAMPEGVESFPMEPGDGVYVPSFRPHFVRSGPEVSISFSITFRTRESERAENVHRFNAKPRRRGRSHRAVGASPMADRARAGMVKVYDRLRSNQAGRREKT